jgi:UPF0716 family protein affecting phage T7 exclusion
MQIQQLLIPFARRGVASALIFAIESYAREKGRKSTAVMRCFVDDDDEVVDEDNDDDDEVVVDDDDDEVVNDDDAYDNDSW